MPYLRLLKALCGCIKSALLWYFLITGKLKERGFTLNPFDPCFANSMIKGTQCTAGWYIDDTKITHVNPDMVTQVEAAIEESFGKMTVTRGMEHITWDGYPVQWKSWHCNSHHEQLHHGSHQRF